MKNKIKIASGYFFVFRVKWTKEEKKIKILYNKERI